jgi:hypothetical protein
MRLVSLVNQIDDFFNSAFDGGESQIVFKECCGSLLDT